MTSPTSAHLYGLWCESPNEVLCVGQGGALLRFDGVTWSLLASPAPFDLYGILGTAPGDLFAVGKHGLILHTPIRYGLTIDVVGEDGCGDVDVVPDLTVYERNSPVTVTAQAAPGYVFAAWVGDVPGPNATNNPLELPMVSDTHLTAVFFPEGGLDPNRIYWRITGAPWHPCGMGVVTPLLGALAVNGVLLLAHRRRRC